MMLCRLGEMGVREARTRGAVDAALRMPPGTPHRAVQSVQEVEASS
jgi:hypothetical protein